MDLFVALNCKCAIMLFNDLLLTCHLNLTLCGSTNGSCLYSVKDYRLVKQNVLGTCNYVGIVATFAWGCFSFKISRTDLSFFSDKDRTPPFSHSFTLRTAFEIFPADMSASKSRNISFALLLDFDSLFVSAMPLLP